MFKSHAISRSLWLFSALVGLLPISGKAKDEPIVVLASAIKRGELDAVETLLAKGLDPNQRVPGSHLGYTPLFLAVEANQLAITRALLKAGADPKIEDENGDPVMTMAADPEHLAEAKLLIEHGVSIDFKNSSGITALLRVAPYAEKSEIQSIIDLGADPNLTDPEGNTALMIAAANDKLATAEILIKAGAKIDLRNKEGKTALQLVFDVDGYRDETEVTRDIVKLLITSGADINQRDSEGRSLLLRAVSSLYLKPLAIQTLLEFKPDLHLRDKDGQDALFHIVLKDNPKLPAQRLIDLGADVMTVDNEDVNLLMMAASNSSPAQVRFFLDQGLSPKSRSKQGGNAIHYAARRGQWANSKDERDATVGNTLEILKLLESRGGSLTDADLEGETPLHLAAMAGTAPVVAYLLPHYPAADLRDVAGDTPLHLAAGFGAAEVIDLLIPKYKDIDLRDGKGSTPLMNASANSNEESILRLLEAGADINAKDKQGVTAFAAAWVRDDIGHMKFLLDHRADPRSLADPNAELLRAARQFHIRPLPVEDYCYLIELLSGLAADINCRDSDKMTASMWVAASNNQAALKAILKHYPDLQLRSPDGRTAMMWAGSSGAAESMHALREAGADDALRDQVGRTAADWLTWSRSAKANTRVDLPSGGVPLRERIAQSRHAALTSYVKQGKWNAGDRIAGSSPLHLAAALGDTDAIAALLKLGAPPNQSTNDSLTPLMEAAADGQLKAVELLLDQGADPALRDVDQQRAIDYSVGFGHIEIARLLLRQKEPLSEDETSLLASLVQRGDKELLRDFLKAGASIPAKNKRTESNDCLRRKLTFDAPILAAAAQPDPDFLKILAEFPTATGFDDASYLATALHFAAGRGHMGNVKYLVESRKVDPNVLQEESFGGVTRVNSNGPDEKKAVEGFSALSRALESGQEEVVCYLIQQGAAITGRTRSGAPPLTFVIEHHRPDLLKLFLENKAATELVDFNGQTPLHVAAASNDAVAVRLLLVHGADPDAKNPKGMTPLDLARKHGAKETAALLETHAK